MARTIRDLTLEQLLEHTEKAIRDAWDKGHRDIDIAMQRSAVEVFPPTEIYGKYESGPTIKITITMRNPTETRREIIL